LPSRADPGPAPAARWNSKIGQECRTVTRTFIRTALILTFVFAVCAATTPASAHANLVRAEPDINASVLTAPTTVRLSFSEAPEPRYSQIMVYNAAHERFDRNDLHAAPGDRESLIVSLRDMPGGIYTVVWQTVSAVDGHETGGSFAFSVGPGQLSSTTASTSSVTFATPAAQEVVTKWMALLSVTAFVGALGLWLFIWFPLLRGMPESTETQQLGRGVTVRLFGLAGVAALALLVATIAGIIVQVMKATGTTVGSALNPTRISDFLFTTHLGSIWFVRLLIAGIATLLSGVAIARLRRSPQATHMNAAILVAFVGLVLGINVLLTFSLVSHAAASTFLTPLTVVIDGIHLLAMSFWIGGVLGLVLTVPLLRTHADRAVSPGAVVRRFSNAALISVGVLTLSGAYAGWLHVGSWCALVTTDYGRALIIKLMLFACLIAFGAFNLLWVGPQMALAPERTRRHFRIAIACEAVIGVGVLLVVAVMTGYAPARDVVAQEAGGTPLTQRMKADDLQVALTPSTLQAGPITYDVYVTKGGPVRDAQTVFLRFSSPDLGVEETQTETVSLGNGHYRATGPYTALDGTWQVSVIVRRTARDDATAKFTLPIGATALPTPTASGTEPRVTMASMLYGGGILLLTVGALLVAAVLSGRWMRHARDAKIREPSPATPSEPRAHATVAD
jgi:copper transport protein